MSRVGRSGQQNDGMGVLTKLLKSKFAAESGPGHAVGPQVESCADHWMNVTVVSLYNCGLSVRVHVLVVQLNTTFNAYLLVLLQEHINSINCSSPKINNMNGAGLKKKRRITVHPSDIGLGGLFQKFGHLR
ncbi:hypothetical protein L6452_34275 [Arctium lappa]|uniref:Uncharacterized protein n=1 Tax=Arctium lappa TaxID=4217 RepID=A0ACB8YJC2_ARCLA|nr:hypothetical protein L6452_34275 [Arctium lappa]